MVIEMTSDELNKVMHEWGMNAAQLAKVLCLHSNKMSEYLGDVERIPCAIAFSVDALQRIPQDERKLLFGQRLNRETHARS
jgi:hypothetical protein